MKIILVKRYDKKTNDINHWFSHKFAEHVAKLFIRANISADVALCFFFLCGISSVITFYHASEILHYFGAYILWRFHIVLDMADGHIARYFRTTGPRGQYWDRLAHMIINPLLLAVLVNCVLQESHTRHSLVICTLTSTYLQIAVKYFANVPQKERSNRLNTIENRTLQILFVVFLDILSIEGQILCLSLSIILDFPVYVRHGIVFYLLLFNCLTSIYRFRGTSKALNN